MPKKRNKLNNKDLEKKCIKKFFLSEYKHIAQAGGKKMQSIGLEASLEMCEELFKEKKLIMKAFDENAFYVFLKQDKNQFELIYDSTEE